ncbi:uncharacterized protein [Cicer arietinum]|uniref:uncharacterized protein isoform X1 n=1 Tax=Cicer arietinum TaxID=3827 RepID=UPI003CC58CFE
MKPNIHAHVLYFLINFCTILKALQEGRHAHNNESTSINASSQNNGPDKHVLESVLDFLQRKDSDDLFGEPTNPDMVKDYHIIVKEPMDFGTMRAKVHEGMYTTLEQFKYDVFLLCFNAINAYPDTSRYHKVAETIGCHAVKIFEDLNADPENFKLELSFNKKRQTKKPLERKPRVSTKVVGRSNNTNLSKVPKTEKRFTYQLPCNKSLITEFQNANKPNFELKIDPSNYKESILRFVKDCGPIAQKVAAQKIETLQSLQLQNGNTSTSNIVKNISDSQLTPQPTTLNSTGQMLPPTFPFFNKPLTIHHTQTQQKTNVISNAANKDKTKFFNENYEDFAAAFLYMSVYDNDEKGKYHVESEISNADMVSKLANVLNNIKQQKIYASKQKMPIFGSSSSNVPIIVHPSRVISGPQTKPLDFSMTQFISQSRPTNSMSFLGDHSYSKQSPILCHSRPINNTTSNINVSSSKSLLHSEPMFPREMEASLLCLGTPYQPGDFQAIMSSQEFNKSYNQNQVISKMNPLELLSLQGPSSSKTLEVDLRREMNYNGGGDALVTKHKKDNSQLSDDDDRQPILTLKLF